MKDHDPILEDILKFFCKILEKKDSGSHAYAAYKKSWLKEIGLDENSKEEAMTSRTTKKLQQILLKKYQGKIKIEAPVAEGMTLRFEKIDSSKMQAFDILDLETGTAYEISLSDAFAEFFKDVLKALLDSRVKKLYICMRSHHYKGSKKSGFAKVSDSKMVQQYIVLARLYKLEIHLVDIFPECTINK